MESQDKYLQGFWRLLEERPRCGGAPADFPEFCRRLHVAPGRLNEILLRETGYSGEEIILIW